VWKKEHGFVADSVMIEAEPELIPASEIKPAHPPEHVQQTEPKPTPKPPKKKRGPNPDRYFSHLEDFLELMKEDERHGLAYLEDADFTVIGNDFNKYAKNRTGSKNWGIPTSTTGINKAIRKILKKHGISR